MYGRPDNSKAVRSQLGHSIAELPLTLFVIFMVLLFPLLNLSLIGLRITSLYVAARAAASSAGRAATFQQDSTPEQLSAVNIARQVAQSAHEKLGGGVVLRTSDIHVAILGSPTNTGDGQMPIRSEEPLAAVFPARYIYQIEVTATGQVSPFIPVNLHFLGSIPGLTEPMVITASSKEFAENPQGLTR